jgi:polyferredoxin
MLLRFFLPLALGVGGGFFISWKWGRLYCGWLCPHFSVVEIINALMRRSIGKLSLWDRKKLPEKQCDGTHIKPNKKWGLVTALMVFLFSFTWAVVLLTYLLPPKEIYLNLIQADLTRNQFIFISVATFLLMLEFTLARHLFCRFGCAIGLVQSLVWMANKRALVVGFNRQRAKQCGDCDSSCDHACPMHLNPRSLKRHMFTCTQCMQCVDACEKVQNQKQQISLLSLLNNDCALDVSARSFGHKPKISKNCYAPKNLK